MKQMLSKYLNISLKGYHSPWGANLFPQFSWYLRKRRNQIKTTQRDAQRSDECGGRRKLRTRLSAGISERLLTYFYRMGQQRNIHKSREREGASEGKESDYQCQMLQQGPWNQKKQFCLVAKSHLRKEMTLQVISQTNRETKAAYESQRRAPSKARFFHPACSL